MIQCKKYGKEALGCYADGSFGHDHVRTVLCMLLRKSFDRRLVEASELITLLEQPMSDDGQEEYDAIDLLNEHATEGTFFEFSDGDLMLSEEEQCT